MDCFSSFLQVGQLFLNIPPDSVKHRETAVCTKECTKRPKFAEESCLQVISANIHMHLLGNVDVWIDCITFLKAQAFSILVPTFIPLLRTFKIIPPFLNWIVKGLDIYMSIRKYLFFDILDFFAHLIQFASFIKWQDAMIRLGSEISIGITFIIFHGIFCQPFCSLDINN